MADMLNEQTYYVNASSKRSSVTSQCLAVTLLAARFPRPRYGYSSSSLKRKLFEPVNEKMWQCDCVVVCYAAETHPAQPMTMPTEPGTPRGGAREVRRVSCAILIKIAPVRASASRKLVWEFSTYSNKTPWRRSRGPQGACRWSGLPLERARWSGLPDYTGTMPSTMIL